MARLTSTLTMQLVDNVSKPARSVAQALKDAERQAKAVAKGMADTGASDKLVKSLSRLALSKKDIEQVSSAWKDYAKSAGLAGGAANWTKSQAAAVRNWEAQTLASLRAVKREQAAFQRAVAKPAGGAKSRHGLGEALLGLGTGYKAKEFAKKAIVSAAEFDIGVRKQREFTDISAGDQAELLKQAKKIGQDTQFSNLDVVKAQTKAMQGLPTSFTSKMKAHAAQGILENVKNYALVMEADLETSSEGLRSYLQNVGKDISTPEKAMFESRKAVNQLVKMAKAGGMNDEDVQQFIKFAGSPGSVAGLTPESIMALGAVARRGGLRGDEFGVAMRTASSKLVSPTRQGLTALQAAGIDHSKYVRMPEKLDVGAFEGHAARELGVKMNDQVRGKLSKIFSDKKIIGDRGAFSAAVTEAMDPLFPRNKKGQFSAKDKQAVGRAAGSFQKVSAQSVDAQKLLDDIMMSNMSLAQLNSLFTDKHGGKFAITQRQREEYISIRKAQMAAGDDPDFAKRKADEIMGGLGGSLERFKGSIENLTLSIGEANAKWLAPAFEKAGNVLDALSNLPEPARQAATALGAIGAATAGVAGFKALFGGFGLSASATALQGSAAALTAAATRLGGAPIAGAGGAGAAGAAAPGPVAAAVVAAFVPVLANIAAGNPLDFGLSPQAAKAKNDKRRALEASHNPGGSSRAQDETLKLLLRGTAAPKVDTSALDGFETKAGGAKDTLQGLNMTVKPNIDSSGIDVFIAKVERARAAAASLGSVGSGLKSLGSVQRGSFTTAGVQGQ